MVIGDLKMGDTWDQKYTRLITVKSICDLICGWTSHPTGFIALTIKALFQGRWTSDEATERRNTPQAPGAEVVQKPMSKSLESIRK